MAIGNAPTALFRLLELLDEDAPRPALVLAFPVGFIGAAEAKEALIERQPAVLTLPCAAGAAAVGWRPRPSTPWLWRRNERTHPTMAQRGRYRRRRARLVSATARAIVEAGEILVGGERHLQMVPDHPGERLRWRCPLEATLDDLEALRGRRVVVLASGDPMWFGVGELLARRFDPSELRVLPAPSAFSLVCARLGWSLGQVACLSTHSRPLVNVRRHLAPGAD